jgi:UDP-N-acetylglucosamine 2-epimerase
MDDPQELLNEDKRVFVIDNVSYEEISSLIEDSLELSGSSSCIAKELGEF